MAVVESSADSDGENWVYHNKLNHQKSFYSLSMWFIIPLQVDGYQNDH